MSCEACAETLSRYDYGQTVRVTATFTDENGDAVDPSAVYLSYVGPDEEVVTLQYGVDAQVIKSSTGVYYVDLTPEIVGDWYYRWWSTGTGKASKEGMFEIKAVQALES